MEGTESKKDDVFSTSPSEKRVTQKDEKSVRKGKLQKLSALRREENAAELQGNNLSRREMLRKADETLQKKPPIDDIVRQGGGRDSKRNNQQGRDPTHTQASKEGGKDLQGKAESVDDGLLNSGIKQHHVKYTEEDKAEAMDEGDNTSNIEEKDESGPFAPKVDFAETEEDGTEEVDPISRGHGKKTARKRALKQEEKRREMETEELIASTQKLLRETRGVSFRRPELQPVSVSSVLEKIRLRKQQWGFQKCEPQNKKPKVGKPLPLDEINHAIHNDVDMESPDQDVNNDDDNDVVIMEKEPGGLEADKASGKSGKEEPPVSRATPERFTIFRPPLEDTQDLSQPSCDEEREKCEQGSWGGANDLGHGPSVQLAAATRLHLHFDNTQSQDDDDPWADENDDKENQDPKLARPRPRVSSLRSNLIDDEAEDEDEGADAPRGHGGSHGHPDKGEGHEDEEEEEGEELHDVDVEGEEGDREEAARKRNELHRKWLEKQEDAAEEDLLNRVRNGWKPSKAHKMSRLGEEEKDDDGHRDDDGDDDDVEDAEGEGMNDGGDGDESRGVEDAAAAAAGMEAGGEKGADRVRREGEWDLSEEELEEESEEEALEEDDATKEAEQRQRFMEESASQECFPEVTHDESSREILGRIKRENLVTAQKAPTASSQVPWWQRGVTYGPQPLWNSKNMLKGTAGLPKSASELNRNGSGSGSSHSFIFRSDDSRSADGFSNRTPASPEKGTEPEAGQSSRRPFQPLTTSGLGSAGTSPRGGSSLAKSKSKLQSQGCGLSMFDRLRKGSTLWGGVGNSSRVERASHEGMKKGDKDEELGFELPNGVSFEKILRSKVRAVPVHYER